MSLPPNSGACAAGLACCQINEQAWSESGGGVLAIKSKVKAFPDDDVDADAATDNNLQFLPLSPLLPLWSRARAMVFKAPGFTDFPFFLLRG